MKLVNLDISFEPYLELSLDTALFFHHIVRLCIVHQTGISDERASCDLALRGDFDDNMIMTSLEVVIVRRRACATESCDQSMVICQFTY